MHIILILAVIILVPAIYFLSPIPLFPGPRLPAKIGSFDALSENQTLKFFFTVMDKNNAEISTDAHVSFNVTAKGNDILYADDFDIKKSEFVYIERTIFGYSQKFYGYYWEIPFSRLNYVPPIGNVSLTVTTTDGKVLTEKIERVLRW